MKRFASLDFLRGFAIFLMIGLHVINGILNTDALMDNMTNQFFLEPVITGSAPVSRGLSRIFPARQRRLEYGLHVSATGKRAIDKHPDCATSNRRRAACSFCHAHGGRHGLQWSIWYIRTGPGRYLSMGLISGDSPVAVELV